MLVIRRSQKSKSMIPAEDTLFNNLRSLPREQRVEPLTKSFKEWMAEKLSIAADSIDCNARFGEISPVLDNDSMRWRLLITPWVKEKVGFRAFHLYEVTRINTVNQLAEYISQEMEPLAIPESSLNEVDIAGHWGWAEPEPYHGDSRVNGKMVFVLGAGRSGTSLFRSMLNCNDNVYAPNELHLVNFDNMATRRDQLNRLSQQWMNVGLVETFQTLFGMSDLQAIQEVNRFAEHSVPVEEVYQKIHTKLADQWLVDKTPAYAQHPMWLQRCEQMFENPRFIYMTRHPYGVMDSYISKRFYRYSAEIWGKSPKNAWHQAELFWTMLNKNIMEFVAGIPQERVLRITYENLMQDTKRVISDVCEFLSIPFEEIMLRPYSPDGYISSNISERSDIDHGLGEAWRDKQPPHEIGSLTRQVAQQLGYSLS